MTTITYRIYLHNFLCLCRYFAMECGGGVLQCYCLGGGGQGSMVGLNGRAISLLCLLTTGVLLSTVYLVSLEEQVNQF